MAYDYTDDVAFAQEMIAEFGRAVVMVRASATPGDATKPLHGPSAAPTRVTDVMAAFVELSSVQRLGAATTTGPGFWKEATKVMLIAPDGTNDFTTFTAVEDDDGNEWKITMADAFKPGDTVLLYFVGVKR